MEIALPRTRRLRLVEAMILIAATAVGLSLSRGHRVGYSYPPETVFESIVPGWAFVEVGRWFVGLLPCLAAWSSAVLILETRRKRRRFRQLFQQPGALACSVVTVLIAAGSALALLGLTVAEPWTRGLLDWVTVPSLVSLMTYLAAVPVALAWMILLMRRQWRPEPGGVDGIGQVLGLLLIVGFAATVWLRLSPL
ncbi:MAG TPA: hypothetical protein VGZ22_09870 [Isosphaeraceae bacterium]|jgi:hypothetical protein|nr:hypothetical protein [Isosphaeraceae bacterium]